MARWDTIQVEGQPMRVYLDVPAGGGAAPGIVVIQHGAGVDRFIEDRVEDLARHGYVAAAPDLSTGNLRTEPTCSRESGVSTMPRFSWTSTRLLRAFAA